MTDKSSKAVPLGILLGIAAGAALGATLPAFMQAIDFIGRIFINALQVVVIPLVVAAIISGVASFGDLSKIGRTGVRIILYFAATSAIAVVIGLVLALVFSPGSGVAAEALRSYGLSGGYPVGNISDMLSSLIPFNLAAGVVGGQYLGLVLFAVLMGGILATMGAGARTVTTFFRQINDALMRLVRLLLLAAPLGVFSIVGSAVAANTGSVEGLSQGFGWYALTILIGLALQAFVVLPLVVGRFAGRAPVDYFRNFSPALLTALGTSSSTAALPVTYECAVNEGRVDQRAGALVLPLGSLANLNGTAMTVIIATIFLANVFEVSLSALQIALITVTTLLVSIGAAGMPMATPVITTIVLGVAGFTPVQILAGTSLIMALDWLVDRGRAFVNVWGDAVGAAVIAETFEFKTARRAPARAADKKRESTRTPRGRSRSDSDRGRGRQDTRGGRRPSRGAPTRDSRPARADSDRPAPPPREQRGQTSPKAAESDSPFGISAPSKPVFDIEGGAPSPKDASRPEPQPDRQPPQRGRSRDDSSRAGGGVRQRESAGDRSRGRRPEKESAESGRPTRRTTTRERRPVARKQEDSKPLPRRDSRPQTPVEAEPKVPIAAQPEPTEAKSSAEPVTPDGRLSPATVARELAKVSAQLAGAASAGTDSKSVDEKPREALPEERQPEAKDQETVTDQRKDVPPAPEEKRQDSSFPPSNVAVKVSSSLPQEPVEETKAPAATEEEPSEKPQFGRSRSRKGMRPPREDAPKPVADKDKPEIPAGYSTESASFGRGKKKRVR